MTGAGQLALILGLVASCAPAPGGEIILASGGHALVRITAPEDPQPVLKRAVADLTRYLNFVTGADFNAPTSATGEICILDAPPEDAPAELKGNREAFWIDARAGKIRIAGGSAVGAAFGIYSFLEDTAGVRWFLPALDGEHVPFAPELRMHEGSRVSKPAFEMRWVATGVWALRNGCNPLSIGDVKTSSGLVSVGFRFQPGIYHTQRTFMPMAKYYVTHPQFYALVDGVRKDFAKDTKLCTSNPEVVREFARNVGRYIDRNPGLDVVSISPADHPYYCECLNCTALDVEGAPASARFSRRMSVFYKAVILELRKTHPAARIAVGAYSSYTDPPEDTSLVMPSDTNIVLAHYQPACLAHPVNDTSCGNNVKYNAILRNWLKRSSGVYFYEYYWKNNWLGLPWPVVHTIAADIPYFCGIGVKGLFTQATTDNAYTGGLNYYIAAKLLWNPKADVRALTDEYYTLYFAEAAVPVREYHQLLEARMAKVEDDIPGDAWKNGVKVFTPELLVELQECLARALASATTDTTHRRIARLQLHLDYTRCFAEGLELLAAGDIPTAKKRIGELREDVIMNPEKWKGIVARTDADEFVVNQLSKLP